MSDATRALAVLAGRQHGVVSRAQLRALGWDRTAVWRRVQRGLLHPVHTRVYAVGYGRLTLHGRYMAAVLACGDGAVLSHRSAAALWELRPTPSGPIDVTVRGGGGRYRAGLRVHTTRSLDAADVARRSGIPCTSVARTLLDIAATASPREIDRLIEQAMILRIYDRNALDAALTGGREGSRALRARLAKAQPKPRRFRSELERRFFELVQDAGLPLPIVNGSVEGHEVDFHWPAQRLVVETDGHATHDTPIARERDYQRDLDLELAGWHVVRLSWRQVTEQPERVTAILAKAGRSSRRPASS